MFLLRKIYYRLVGIVNFFLLKKGKVVHHGMDIRGILLIDNKGGNIAFGEKAVINSSKYANIIGGDTRSSIIVKLNAKLTIGKNFRMSNSAIYCADTITIGDHVMIGGSCKIWDSDFHSTDTSKRESSPNEFYKTRPIIIGNSVFIGGSSIILKGVSIGDGAIIGAGSVVSRSIPPGEVWGGNPAVFIKKVEQAPLDVVNARE